MDPKLDLWLHYTLGAAVIGALGIAGSMVVKKLVEWVINWFGRVNTALEALSTLMTKVDTLLDRIKSWDIGGLRNHINVLGLRARLNTAKLENHSIQLLQIREILAEHGIVIPPAPEVSFRTRNDDRDLLDTLIQLHKQTESAVEEEKE